MSTNPKDAVNDKVILFFIVAFSIYIAFLSLVSEYIDKEKSRGEILETNAISQQKIGPSATIDPNSLKTYLSNPTISGTASGVSSVIILLADRGEAFWTSDLVPVIGNHWSVTVSIPNYTIPVGKYKVIVNSSDNPHNLLPPLTTETLVISAK